MVLVKQNITCLDAGKTDGLSDSVWQTLMKNHPIDKFHFNKCCHLQMLYFMYFISTDFTLLLTCYQVIKARPRSDEQIPKNGLLGHSEQISMTYFSIFLIFMKIL